MLHWLAAHWLLFPVVTAGLEGSSTKPPVRDQSETFIVINNLPVFTLISDRLSGISIPTNLPESIQNKTMTIQCPSEDEVREHFLIMNVSRKYFEKLNKNVGYFIMLKLVLQQSIRVSYGSEIFQKYFYERQKTY